MTAKTVPKGEIEIAELTEEILCKTSSIMIRNGLMTMKELIGWEPP